MTLSGVGKTYLAAFDSKNYRTVLFVAHREEILRQAALSFRNVRGSDDYGFFDGNSKCTDKSVIFANVATLGQERYLTEKYFAPDRFSYHGDVRMAVTDEELLTEWKAFFGSGTNWRDLKPDGTYRDYLAISDKAHLSNILSNPVHFLQKSGKGFFTPKEGYALAIREDLSEIAKTPAFAQHMGDIIDYRTMDYYQRRYHESCV